MSVITRETGHWRWNGRRFIYEPFEDSQPLIETTHEDNIELETYDGEDNLIDLDEPQTGETSLTNQAATETSFLQTTPIGGTAGAFAGTSGGILSGSATASTAVGLGAATIAAGVLGGILGRRKHSDDSDHIDPVVSLPGHHYIGPGNTISEVKPIDVDDDIAREHDIAYSNSKTQEDVQQADHSSANEFLSDVIHNNNYHSIIGAVGLKTKEVVESVVGVQYPANLPSSSVSGMTRWNVKPAVRTPFDPHSDPYQNPRFRQLTKPQQNYAWSQWNLGRQNRRLTRVDPPIDLNIAVTPRPRLNHGVRPSSHSIPYNAWIAGRGHGPLIESFNRQIDAHNNRILQSVEAHELSPNELAEVEAISKQIQGGSISPSDFDDQDGAGPSGVQIPAPPTEESSEESEDVEMAPADKRPHEGDQGGNEPPPQPVPVAAAPAAARATANTASDGGFDNNQGPTTVLPKGRYRTKGGTMMFEKVHRMKSWAIPYWNINAPTVRGGANIVTTPLAKIPWEYAYLYMSPDEFALIPPGSYIDSVSVEITQIVAQTGYPTGGTTTTVATTNHPKVLVIGEDLEAKIRGGVDRPLELTANMIPSLNQSLDDWTTDFIAKQYGTDQTSQDGDVVVPGVGHKIPFYNTNHFCIYQPNREQAIARGFFGEAGDPAELDFNFSPGFEYFQNAIVELNANDTTWSPVAAMHYKFTNAPIGDQYPALEILTDDFNQSVGTHHRVNAKRNVSGMSVAGDPGISETFVPSSYNNRPIVTYKSAPMEQGSYFVRGDAPGKPSRQPTFHIGMRAIDKSDPTLNTSRAVSFVQANIEFEIKATMVINLPSYPNRFIRPKLFTTSIENAVQGIQTRPAYIDRFATFGLLNETNTVPPVNAIDATSNDDETEDGMVMRSAMKRPRRALPVVPVMLSKNRRRRRN